MARTQALACLLLISCMMPSAGCNLVGGFYGVFIDPFVPAPLVRAEHDMSDKRVLIWVDDLAAGESYPTLRRHLTEGLVEALQTHSAVASVVPYDKVAHFRVLRPEHKQMPIKELGDAFQADEVIYLQVDQFKITHDAGQGYYQPEFSGHAKIIDCHQDGQRVWPETQAQYPFGIEGEFEQGQGESFENRLVRKLSETFARQFVFHFYDHRTKK